MPPKTKRNPHPVQHHLKHSRQLLEDFLYQHLPQLSGLGSISRLNIYSWFSGRWGLSADATAGVPYMILEALRLQRQHLLQQKLPLKPLSLSLLGSPEDNLQPRALALLEEVNRQSHTAKINSISLPEQDLPKQLNLLLQRQPAAERNLLLLDPLELSLPPLAELLPLLPRRLDVFMALPTLAIRHAHSRTEDGNGMPEKNPPHEAVLTLSERLYPLLAAAQAEQPEAPAMPLLLKKLKEQFAAISHRYVMHYQPAEESPLVLFGFTADSLMMEKMLLSRHKLEQLALAQKQPGHQLGLFRSSQEEQSVTPDTLQEGVLSLLARQEEWSNQELYDALLHNELLPQQVLPLIQELVDKGKLAVLDEKRKKRKASSPLHLSQTAYRLPAPSLYLRLLP